MFLYIVHFLLLVMVVSLYRFHIVIFRGTCQPYCRSLPDDPFLECFEFPDAKNIQGFSLLPVSQSVYLSNIMLGYGSKLRVLV